MIKTIDTNTTEDKLCAWDIPVPVMACENKPSNLPAAGTLNRFHGNPVLKPIREHSWESKYVLNAATLALEGKLYLVYRAYGEDEISRLGLAISRDGFEFNERLTEPIFEPVDKSERRGCEDPRLTLLGGRIYMTYTAYDGEIAQIALASISTTDFVNYCWDGWHRHGLFLPGLPNKDAVLFPEDFNGQYVMLHRIEPHIWISFAPKADCPWHNSRHKVLAEASEKVVWDSQKIGAGSQPIKTKYGWLLITHGVDCASVYRLGVMLLDLNDPSKLIYRSPNFILEPTMECELGGDDASWVPNVVFTCGAIPRDMDKYILDEDDELIVYYGAADTVINVATATIGELIPSQIRDSDLYAM